MPFVGRYNDLNMVAESEVEDGFEEGLQNSGMHGEDLVQTIIADKLFLESDIIKPPYRGNLSVLAQHHNNIMIPIRVEATECAFSKIEENWKGLFF